MHLNKRWEERSIWRIEFFFTAWDKVPAVGTRFFPACQRKKTCPVRICSTFLAGWNFLLIGFAGATKKLTQFPQKKRKIWHCNALLKKGLLLAGPFFVWVYWLLGTRQVTWTEKWKSEKAQQQSRSAKRILIWFFFVRLWKVLQIGNCYCGKKCEFHTASGDHFAPFTFWTDSGYQ